MKTPWELLKESKTKIKTTWRIAFVSALVLGLLIHLPVMLSDIPNHDGLSSMYFDQNMITSGRWFLTVACGFSSYFTIPWVIGLIGLIWLALTAAVLTEVLELTDPVTITVVSGLLVSFPALASTFAYVFTMDGYMLALFLAVLAVLFTAKYPRGYLAGAVCLAFSMGIYQAYLPFTILLCVYKILLYFMEEKGWKEKAKYVCHYLGMGIAGGVLYYVILQILLKLQGRVLDTYQGINSMEQMGSGMGILATIKEMYVDFLAFTVHGNVLVNNIFSLAACIILVATVVFLVIRSMIWRKWWKNPAFFVIMILLGISMPLLTNVILLISPNLTYHLLMRYQWVLYLILMTVFADGIPLRRVVRTWYCNGQHCVRRWYWCSIMEFPIISDIPIWRKSTRRRMRIVYVCWTGSSRLPDIIRGFPLHWWESSAMMNSLQRISRGRLRTV